MRIKGNKVSGAPAAASGVVSSDLVVVAVSAAASCRTPHGPVQDAEV